MQGSLLKSDTGTGESLCEHRTEHTPGAAALELHSDTSSHNQPGQTFLEPVPPTPGGAYQKYAGSAQ